MLFARHLSPLFIARRRPSSCPLPRFPCSRQSTGWMPDFSTTLCHLIISWPLTLPLERASVVPALVDRLLRAPLLQSRSDSSFALVPVIPVMLVQSERLLCEFVATFSVCLTKCCPLSIRVRQPAHTRSRCSWPPTPSQGFEMSMGLTPLHHLINIRALVGDTDPFRRAFVVGRT